MARQFQEQTQEVLDLSFREGVSSDPPVLQRLGISNLIRRVWATLWAFDGNSPVRVQATSDGRLKVASTSGGFSNVEVLNETGTAAYVTYTFPEVAAQVDFIVENYGLYIETSPDGDVYGDAVIIGAGQTWSPPVSVKSFKIKNSSTTGNGSIQAIGYY